MGFMGIMKISNIMEIGKTMEGPHSLRPTLRASNQVDFTTQIHTSADYADYKKTELRN